MEKPSQFYTKHTAEHYTIVARKNSIHRGYDTALLGYRFRTFWRAVVPSSSRV